MGSNAEQLVVEAREAKAKMLGNLINPLDYARHSPSGKYVVLRRTVTVTLAVPIEDYVHTGDSETETKYGRQMTEDEVREYEQSMTGADAFENLTGMVESAPRESLIEHTVRVDFGSKS